MAFDRYDTIALGQEGSAFLDTAATTFTPAAPFKIIAITMITDCKFSALVASDTAKFIGTSGAGKGGDTFAAADVIPAGVTIYGSWDSASVSTNGEQCICYIG
mgnify:CR=1 FL=1